MTLARFIAREIMRMVSPTEEQIAAVIAHYLPSSEEWVEEPQAAGEGTGHE